MLSTHVMQEVEAVCNRVIIIDKGIIVADDSTQNLSSRSFGRNKIRVEFNKKINDKLLMKIKGIDEVIQMDGNIFEISSEMGDAREQIFQFAVKNGLVVLSMQEVGKGIEAVFQQLTRG